MYVSLLIYILIATSLLCKSRSNNALDTVASDVIEFHGTGFIGFHLLSAALSKFHDSVSDSGFHHCVFA